MLKATLKKELTLATGFVPETTQLDLKRQIPSFMTSPSSQAVTLFKNMVTGQLFAYEKQATLSNPKAIIRIDSTVSNVLADIKQQDRQYEVLIKTSVFLENNHDIATIRLLMSNRIGFSALNEKFQLNLETCAFITNFIIDRLTMLKIDGRGLFWSGNYQYSDYAVECPKNADGTVLNETSFKLLETVANFVFKQGEDFSILKTYLLGTLLLRKQADVLSGSGRLKTMDSETKRIYKIIKNAVKSSADIPIHVNFDALTDRFRNVCAIETITWKVSRQYSVMDYLFEDGSIADLLGNKPIRLHFVRWFWSVLRRLAIHRTVRTYEYQAQEAFLLKLLIKSNQDFVSD